MTKTIKINIFSENIHKDIEVNEKKAIETARKILDFYLEEKDIFDLSCLTGQDFNCISFDMLYCNNEKIHQINKEYRRKDSPTDIITFAIFADSEEKFIFDKEINLGEIIISLDKVTEAANSKQQIANGKEEKETLHPFTHSPVQLEAELYFLISHGIMHLLGFDHQTNEDYNFIIEAQTSALKKVRGASK